MQRTAVVRALAGAALFLALPAAGQPAGGDAYDAAVRLVTPDMMAACEQRAMQAIAEQVRVGAAIDWREKMAPGDMGRRISGSWAERVGATQPGPGDAPPPDGYLAAVTGVAHVKPQAGPETTLVPVCWFDHQPAQGTVTLYQVTLRMLPNGPG